MQLQIQQPIGQEFDNERISLITYKKYRSFWQILLMVLSISLSSFYFGHTICYLGTFTFSNIVEMYGIDFTSIQSAQGVFNGFIFVGAALGSTFSSLLLTKFSRRNCLFVTNAIAFLSGWLIFIKNQYLFLFLRTIQGFCVGLCSSIAPLLIKQYSPLQLSGTFGALTQLLIATGIVTAYGLQLFLNTFYGGAEKKYYWVVFSVTLVTVFLQTLLFLFIYKHETPKYLLSKFSEDKCREFLRQIYFDEFVEEVLHEKKLDLLLCQSEVGCEKNSSNRMRSAKRVRFAVSLHLNILQQFTGINPIGIYGIEIAATVMPEFAHVVPVVFSFLKGLTSVFASYFLLRMGRKQILQLGTFISFVCVLSMTIGLALDEQPHRQNGVTLKTMLVLGGMIVYMGNFGFSLGSVVYLYTPQIVQPEQVPFALVLNWAAAATTTILFPILKNKFGSIVPLFSFFSAYSLIGFAISQKYLIETKGKTEKQIYEQYERKFG